jgi:hypothetical protein
MVDAELGGDGADLPVFAVVEAANLGVLFGRDHGDPSETRDGPARTGEGATRSRGYRPHTATRPPGAWLAIDPSTCQRGVCPTATGGGKCDPSRGRDRHADDPDDRGGLQDSGGVGLSPRRSCADARRRDSAASSTRGRDHRRHRSRRLGNSAGRFSGEGAYPRRRSSGPLQLDVQPKPWHNRQDGLGASEPEAVTRVRRSSPGPHPQPPQPTRDHSSPDQRRGHGRCRACGRADAPTSRLENPHRARVSHTVHTHHFSWLKKTERLKARTARRPPSRFTRSQVSGDRRAEIDGSAVARMIAV